MPQNRAQQVRCGGRFVKGVSGSPGGRPRVLRDVQDLARAYTSEALEILADLMHDERTPAAARVLAANSLLSRGWGRPPQSIAIQAERPQGQIPPEELREIFERVTRQSCETLAAATKFPVRSAKLVTFDRESGVRIIEEIPIPANAQTITQSQEQTPTTSD